MKRWWVAASVVVGTAVSGASGCSTDDKTSPPVDSGVDTAQPVSDATAPDVGASDAAKGDVVADAPVDSSIAVVCTGAATGSYSGSLTASATTVGGYDFAWVGSGDGGIYLSVSCGNDGGTFESAWYCALMADASASTMLSRPLDYGTPPDAGRTISVSVLGIATPAASLEVTAP